MIIPEVTFTPAPFEDNMNVDLWPRWHAKYCDIFKVIKMDNPVVNQIIKHAPYASNRRKILIDVRTQYLNTGFYTTGPGWHVDSPDDPDALHHVYILGENRTEFKLDDITVKTIPKGHYATYGPTDKHRGIPVHTEEFRLFIRIQEVNNETLERPTGLKSYYPALYPIDKDVMYMEEAEYYHRFTAFRHLNTSPTT